MARYRIIVKGIVQGVGFRPAVYTLALGLGLKGFVTNTSEGVIIEIEGEHAAEFAVALHGNLPPLASIESISSEEIPVLSDKEFRILRSFEDGGFTHVSPDISICEDCLKELVDPADRRYQYPFINCTNCGPRYSITRQVPYDRPNTTMSVFRMCPQCKAEYDGPSDRRFHAQPNACPVCGPQVKLAVRNEKYKADEDEDPVGGAIRLLRLGAIVAVKGIGGFHLCCDARNEAAVRLLRERKRRKNKAFALMAPDLASIRRFCVISADEETVLLDMRRPIVLLEKADRSDLTEAIAPKNRYLGFMLPYTPLHYLLFHYSADGRMPVHPHFDAIVATSGNLSEEPIVTDNDEALERLSGLADAFLVHDRDIFMRVDDSVVRVSSGRTLFIRRSRGYAPRAVLLGDDMPDVLGCGAEVKNTLTITKGNAAIMSQHIGDMENLETLRFYEETLENLKRVYRSDPVAVAYDLHPGYLATRWALEEIAEGKLQGLGIQHHYAHIASVMAEKQIREKVIGVAWDGTGYGTDGNLWGSEFLVCDEYGFERAGHLAYIPLPGGEMSIRENWRAAVSCLKNAVGEGDIYQYLNDLGFVERFGRKKIDLLLRIMEDRALSPLSSGAGRLFDAVSALAGICYESTYEGEAAVALESMLPEERSAQENSKYSYSISAAKPCVIDISRMIIEITGDIKKSVPAGTVALRFHNTMTGIIIDMAGRIREDSGINRAVLSGGCFQNAALMKGVTEGLSALGFEVLTNEGIPCNDACLSLGQAYILAQRLKSRRGI
jgi:hydrogenase maturation protein HypF